MGHGRGALSRRCLAIREAASAALDGEVKGRERRGVADDLEELHPVAGLGHVQPRAAERPGHEPAQDVVVLGDDHVGLGLGGRHEGSGAAGTGAGEVERLEEVVHGPGEVRPARTGLARSTGRQGASHLPQPCPKRTCADPRQATDGQAWRTIVQASARRGCTSCTASEPMRPETRAIRAAWRAHGAQRARWSATPRRSRAS